MLQKHRNKKAAIRILTKLLNTHPTPRVIVTDKLKSYQKPIKSMFPKTEHRTNKRLNNHFENAVKSWNHVHDELTDGQKKRGRARTFSDLSIQACHVMRTLFR
ncbi:MAG: DDE-type integrase/transposase/recombinase [Alphaproteobacteria bacterium]|nr:DDE-type integrase/transposase/recombinase [Alphaproteobacteria bacterium]